MDISPYLKFMVDRGASDLFFSAGTPVHAKVEGRTRPLDRRVMTGQAVRELAYSLLCADQIAEFEATLEMNLGISRPRLGRYRVNVYRQRGEVAMVVRHIKSEIPSLAALRLPEALGELAQSKYGQIFVVGATGSGKSTTLASMIDYRNRTMPGHIVTIEDPIEFVHEHKRSVVDQREIGFDTRSYEDALRNVLRQAPDVIVIGEIRDRETMEHAHHFAETGHLCLSTLHANNAIQAIERIVNFFPSAIHEQVRQNIASDLRAIVSLRLVTGSDDRVVPAVEILLNTSSVAEAVASGRLRDLREIMDAGEHHGMVTVDQSLYRLYVGGEISEHDALRSADSSNDLRLRIHLGRPRIEGRLARIDTE
jgi:twitching motility protein PilU